MKLIKRLIIIATFIGNIMIFYTVLNGVLYILTELKIVDEEDLEYLEVSTYYEVMDVNNN